MDWIKSGRCDTSSCVEVTVAPEGVYVRNSADPDGPKVTIPLDQWVLFVGEVRNGEFDLQ
jgi:hypothetical protein